MSFSRRRTKERRNKKDIFELQEMTRNTNPFKIREIVAHLFQFLDLEEICQVRGVSRIWNDEACIEIGKRKTIILNNRTTMNNFLTMIESYYYHLNHNFEDQNETEDYMENGHSIDQLLTQPFKRFELINLKLGLDDPKVSRFFTIIGPSIKSIIFNYYEEDYLMNIRDFRDILLFYTPNLEELILQQLPSYDILEHKYIFPNIVADRFKLPLLPNLKSLSIYASSGYNTEFLKNLLESATNLEKIEVEYTTDWASFYNFKEVFLQAFFTSGKKLKRLKSFTFFIINDLRMMWNAEDCKNLQKMNFAFKKLQLHFSGPGVSCSLYEILKSLKNNLLELKLRIEEPIKMPRMDFLHSLILNEYRGDLSFLDSLPYLKFLELYLFSPINNNENISPENIHSLFSLNLCNSSLSSKVFGELAEKLPNLRIFNWTQVTDEHLKILYDCFPLLEELIINATKVTDEGLTGISQMNCNIIYKTKDYSLNYSPDQPSIGSLKKLRRLDLCGSQIGDWRFSKITDISFHFGISRLRQLTSLSLYEFGFEITDSSIKSLRKIPNLLYFKFEKKLFTEESLLELKNKIPNLIIEYIVNDLVKEAEDMSGILGSFEIGLEALGPYGIG